MSVFDGGVEYGCSDALEERAYGMSRAARALAQILKEGGSLPSEYTVGGLNCNVVQATGLVANNSTDNVTALNSILGASRGGVPTLVVIPPAIRPYRYSGQITLSTNTYVCAYGVIVTPRAVPPLAADAIDAGDGALEETRWNTESNSGIFGLNMFGLQQSYSRWPERFRFQENYADIGDKNGTYANARDNSNSSAWIGVSSKTNVILFDIQTKGSLQGTLRCDNSTNVLVEGCSAFRTHSDSFHITHDSSYITLRNVDVYNSGDDCISFVQYAPAGVGNYPHNCYVENCRAKATRARGFTCISGRDILWRFCIAEDVSLGGYRFGPTSSHSNDDTRDLKIQDCEAWRCGREDAADNNSAAFAALLATSGFDCLNVQFLRCKAFLHSGDRWAGGTFVRTSGTTVTYTETECSVTTIHYLE